VGPQSGAYANAGTTGWTFDCHKATALIYGHISDNLGNPLAGLDVYANDNSLYQTDAYTDANGNYVLGVVGLGMSDHWNVQADGNHQFNNYVFTQETINGNINAGQAVLQNFTAVLATNQIAGYVSFNGNAVTNLEIFADAAINGTNYHVDINTDANGNYSFGAANGSWTVGVTVSGGDDSLDNILGSGNFQPPPDQVINISNNNAVANFTVLPPNSGQIFGYVTDTSGNPVAGVNVGVSDGIGDNYTTTTDAGGYYSFIVNNDNWDAVVDCAGLNSRGYQCVSDQMTAVLDNYVELDFSAQFVNLQLPLRVLHSFTDTSTNSFGAYTNGDGAYLYGGLVLSGNTLYGTAVGGGTNGNGTVFAVDTDIAGFTNLYSFKATEGSFSTNSDGANPQASLILLGNALYGTATVGGTNGSGTVFKLGTNGTGFTTLHPFAAADANPDGAVTNKDGANPQCSLIVSGNAVYGTAAAGGTNGNGTVFKINTDGTGFTNLHTFAATSTDSAGLPTNNDGAYPVAGLTLSGDTLYGTAAVGGINGNGTLFAVKTNGTSFSVLHAFTALDPFFGTNSDGANPVGGLILAGNMLYGTASSGGIAFFGTVFAVGTNGSGFTTLHSFADSDGSNPQAGLILSSNTLYGTALNGGSSGFGAVFEIKTNGTGFGDLYGFTGGSDGANPYGGLVLSGNNLYGTASAGGDAGNGTVFSLPLGSVSTNAPQLTISLAGTLVMLTWPTNATGFTLQSTTNLAPPTVWSTNLPAPVVINGKNTVTNPVTGRQTFYRLSH
jgi:uncharacterized repeat protein (TIGR03803 family)